MTPPPGCPDAFSTPAAQPATSSIVKPPLPTFPTRLSSTVKNIEVQLPPLISGALVAAFAKALVDGLNNELLTHYYLSEQKIQVNLDRVLDRLLTEFTKRLWDELFRFYNDTNEGHSHQVTLLFEGPVRQIVLILNGPETAKCILDRLAPGLSQRPVTWTANAGGIDLPLSLQLICSFWHREYPDLSPGGTPDEIARSLHTHIVNGGASRYLISEVRRVLMSPHFVQMHLAESAVWEIIIKQRARPPADGFRVAQFTLDCRLFDPRDGIGDPELVSISALPAITGTADECIQTSVAEYIDNVWPKCGRVVLECLEEAVRNSSTGYRDGEAGPGMSVWDATADDARYCPGLRLLHIEVENTGIRVSVSAWTHTLIEVYQQICWMCAVLSASPFLGTLSECTVDVAGWTFANDSMYVDCTMSHHPVPEGDGLRWLREIPGAAIARGYPVHIPADPAL